MYRTIDDKFMRIPELQTKEYIDWNDLEGFLKDNDFSDEEIEEFYDSLYWHGGDSDYWTDYDIDCYDDVSDTLKKIVQCIKDYIKLDSFNLRHDW